jgi:hypothetical protein
MQSFTLTAVFATIADLQVAAEALDKALNRKVLTEADAKADLAGTPRPDAKAEAKAPAAPKAAPAPAPKAPPAEAAKPAAKAVAYPELQKAVFALAGKAKALGLDTNEHVLAIAKGLGGATFKDLAPENFAAALEQVNAKLEEISKEEAVA